jgi:hypothetical protein
MVSCLGGDATATKIMNDDDACNMKCSETDTACQDKCGQATDAACNSAQAACEKLDSCGQKCFGDQAGGSGPAQN